MIYKGFKIVREEIGKYGTSYQYRCGKQVAPRQIDIISIINKLLEKKMMLDIEINLLEKNDSEKSDLWDMIPGKCEYNGKVYRILNIDMQGGYFTLHDLESKDGEVQVLEDIDMEKCNPTII